MGRCPCAASCSVERDSKLEVMRILVIEDEVKLAAHLSRALEHDGHEVRVVVLDVELPRMDGFEILKQLRSDGVSTPNLDVDCPK